ncbi:secretin and TonB N-terminal domain-containing protein [Serratia sp. AKBS12]|uniref:secretin and TonB N-terminal domain-containing protein n=1 Tax=Serratia sp. AKBS12 TaxID=2974597 RepID=UPI002165EAF6|nr:secretin and TonB N-terminal domain-containing protein [Serratia sp. AKBS12]MCS3407103.1 secretin and TonB N-terminal domain-containing protein [Serratia sp. AKBS12]HEI8868866.1 secretin and TonB N-terminal domain-containing protein [Serratia odorifera]
MKKLTLTLTLMCSLLSGCAQQHRETKTQIQPTTNDSLISSLKDIDQARIQSPYDAELRARQQDLTEQLVSRYLQEADRAMAKNDYTKASMLWQDALLYQPGNQRARQGLSKMNSWRALDRLYQQATASRASDPEQALNKVNQILEEDPNWPQAKALRDHLLREIAVQNQPEVRLKRELRKPVSLNFRHHNLMSIFDTISQLTGVNIIYDKDVPASMTASLAARNTTAEDALNLLLLSNQLRKKVLNGNTLLIYPATAQKEKVYRDVVVKTVFLGYAKAKDTNVALRNLVKLRDIHIDERTNSVTIRGAKESVEKAERLLMTLDRPEAEVTLAVEVLEVYSKDIEKLGINYPGQVSVGFKGIDGKMENIAMNGFNASNMFVNLGANQGISADLQKVRTNAKVLANPRIRVKNNKKALIDIGERIPVLTSSVSEGISQEKVEYQDVGLKLEVMPEISVDGSISMDVKFKLSSQGGAERSKDDVRYYRTNNREASTVLSSQSGETQMLAGLIKMNDKDGESGIPYLSDIPGLSRLFGSKEKDSERTEVVLLITPTIERNIDLPGRHISTIDMGTEEMQGDSSFQLRGVEKAKAVEAFDVPPLAPPAQFPAKSGALPVPLSSQAMPEYKG